MVDSTNHSQSPKPTKKGFGNGSQGDTTRAVACDSYGFRLLTRSYYKVQRQVEVEVEVEVEVKVVVEGLHTKFDRATST